jgi:hypothetical protein
MEGLVTSTGGAKLAQAGQAGLVRPDRPIAGALRPEEASGSLNRLRSVSGIEYLISRERHWRS